MNRPYGVFLIFAFAFVLLTGCECDAETDEELCAASAVSCGTVFLVDRCEARRQVACGPCGPEDPDAADVWEPRDVSDTPSKPDSADPVDDAADDTRDTQADGDSEVDGGCVDDRDLCAEPTAECGVIEREDHCGILRRLDCGPCPELDVSAGAVRNASTQTLVDEALLKLYRWPPAGAEDSLWAWRQGFRAAAPDTSVRTLSDVGQGRNYAFTDGLEACFEGMTRQRVPLRRWYRTRIDRPDYRSAITYRYYDEKPTPCTMPECAGPLSARCHDEDFRLQPAGALYERLPDLIIDPINLEDHFWQCALMPADAPEPRLIGLRLTAAAPNVGTGGLHLKGQRFAEGDIVHQAIDWSDGTREPRSMDLANFTFDEGRRWLRFAQWLRMSLVDPRSECRTPEDRPADCVAHEAFKHAFCLQDSTLFDEEIVHLQNNGQEYSGGCSDFTQGISPGYKDIYEKELPRQVIIVGPPSEADRLGRRRLEVEVNPRRILFESDYTNNVQSIYVEMPAPAETLCNDPSAILDCTGPPEHYTHIQSRQCPVYLGFLGP